ncbi:RNA-binding S4 domain-containing protein [Colwellia sp. MB3u-4]|uniref:RNA-binding S4 domain-containing protein n=1 Tax=Colwellia sp. MB3u-4 TaxID=2759822 RepID=UPI0015F39FA5|nr:RNA-binding S4 domain-containing protein [Colwellia sp. MB3u-4]MBA6289976.1 RNA-binding S4 domain-containing protein [Colwellia sp. MB3u-4]
MSKHSIIDICVEPIELCNLLKIANMVDGGGEAKTMISEGNVLVNNEVVVQKRKKIRRGDIIKCNGKIIEIAFNPSKKSAEFISTVVLANKNSKKKKRAKSKARIISSETATKPSIKS